MNAVVYLEYLLSPATSTLDQTIKLINELSMLSEHIDLSIPPIIEDDIILKLERDGLYPCDKLFRMNLSKIGESPFSGEDVRRIVNKIIQKAKTFSQVEENRIFDWTSKSTSLPIEFSSKERTNEISSLFESIQISNVLENKNYQTLYYPILDNTASLKGEVGYIFPEYGDVKTPIAIETKSPIYQSYLEYLLHINPHNFYRSSITCHDFKLSFYVAAQLLIRQSENPNRELNWGDFEITETLLRGAQKNEALPGSRYGNLLFETIPQILASSRNIEIKPFRESESSDAQRSYSGYLAYRTHLTKSGRALRLMFWKSEDVIIFTTVGNKHELEIDLPT